MWALARTRCTLAVAGAGRALPVLLGHGLDGGHQLRSLDVDPAVRLAQAQQLRRALAVHGRQRRLVLRAAGVLRKARPGLRKRWSCRGSRAPPLPDTPSQRPVRLARPQAQKYIRRRQTPCSAGWEAAACVLVKKSIISALLTSSAQPPPSPPGCPAAVPAAAAAAADRPSLTARCDSSRPCALRSSAKACARDPRP